jgi:hypothetical protein
MYQMCVKEMKVNEVQKGYQHVMMESGIKIHILIDMFNTDIHLVVLHSDDEVEVLHPVVLHIIGRHVLVHILVNNSFMIMVNGKYIIVISLIDHIDVKFISVKILVVFSINDIVIMQIHQNQLVLMWMLESVLINTNIRESKNYSSLFFIMQ